MKKHLTTPGKDAVGKQSDMRIKVLLVDDHPLVRQGLRACLLLHQEFEVVGEASNGQEAISQAQACSPDIVIMDLSMRGMDGLAATRSLRQFCPGTRVLIFTIHSNREFVRQAFLAGACGYLRKNSSPVELVSAIERIHRGETGVMTKLRSKPRTPVFPPCAPAQGGPRLASSSCPNT